MNKLHEGGRGVERVALSELQNLQLKSWSRNCPHLSNCRTEAKSEWKDNTTDSALLWQLCFTWNRLKKELEMYKDDDLENVCEALRTEIELLQMVRLPFFLFTKHLTNVLWI